MTMLKEEIKKRLKKTRPSRVFSYIHGNGRIGVLLEIESDTDFSLRTQEVEDFAKEICLQIASMNPDFIGVSDVEKFRSNNMLLYLERECENKPKDVANKIITGKLNKWYSEICLLEQPWIKDPKVSVGRLLENLKAILKESITVKQFSRFGQ